jgi:hypothetical protein
MTAQVPICTAVAAPECVELGVVPVPVEDPPELAVGVLA